MSFHIFRVYWKWKCKIVPQMKYHVCQMLTRAIYHCRLHFSSFWKKTDWTLPFTPWLSPYLGTLGSYRKKYFLFLFSILVHKLPFLHLGMQFRNLNYCTVIFFIALKSWRAWSHCWCILKYHCTYHAIYLWYVWLTWYQAALCTNQAGNFPYLLLARNK